MCEADIELAAPSPESQICDKLSRAANRVDPVTGAWGSNYGIQSKIIEFFGFGRYISAYIHPVIV